MRKYILFLTCIFTCVYLQGHASQASLPEINAEALRLQSHPLRNINDSLSLEIYPLTNGSNVAWDDVNEFAQEIDQGFFKRPSRKSKAIGVVAGLIGAVVPHPSCGYVISNIGDFLRVPLSGPLSNALVAGITITTTPIFTQQFYAAGQKMTSYIFKEESFQDPDHEAKFTEKNKAHYALKTTLFANAAINALIPMILMREAEKEFPMFFAFTVFPFYTAWFENAYKVGSSNLDYLFNKYAYSTKINFQKREILKKKIRALKRELRHDDFLVQSLYKIVEEQRVNDFTATQGFPFAFSGLFLRDTVRLEDEGEMINFKIDMESDPHSVFDNLAYWTSAALTGASTYGKFRITQFVLDSLLKEALSEQNAFILSTTLATFEAVHRFTANHHTQTEALKSLRNIFQPQQDCTILRKFSGLVSATNATLFALPNVVAGLKVFSDFSALSKIAIVGPAFLTDYLYYDAFFSKNYNRCITNATTLSKQTMSVTLQRAHLMKHANKALKFVDQFDQETIEKLYGITEKGV